MIGLYQVVSRELSFVQMLDMDMPIDPDAWLACNGYGRDYTLRRGRIIEETPAERAALHKAHDRLKAEGKLPSVAWRLMV